MAVVGTLVGRYSASMWGSPSTVLEMSVMADTRSLAHLIFFNKIETNTLFYFGYKISIFVLRDTQIHFPT